MHVEHENMTAAECSSVHPGSSADFPDGKSSTKAKRACKIQTKHQPIVAQHNYHDHAEDIEADLPVFELQTPRGGATSLFPIRLHKMLESVEGNGYQDVVSWQPHGRCFLIHNHEEFVKLLPEHFKLSKLASFQRQLNIYGFQRLTRGPDRGAYYNEYFLRGKAFLALNIARQRIKGTGVRARSNPDQEPNLWMMPWVGQKGGSSEQDEHVGNDKLASVASCSRPLSFSSSLAVVTRSSSSTITTMNTTTVTKITRCVSDDTDETEKNELKLEDEAKDELVADNVDNGKSYLFENQSFYPLTVREDAMVNIEAVNMINGDDYQLPLIEDGDELAKLIGEYGAWSSG